jgi:hypothetical protein
MLRLKIPPIDPLRLLLFKTLKSKEFSQKATKEAKELCTTFFAVNLNEIKGGQCFA